MGVTQISPIGSIARKDYYRLEGAKPRLFVTTESDVLTGVGVVLSKPSTPIDTDVQIALAAFTLAKISGLPEGEIKPQLGSLVSTVAAENSRVVNFGNGTAAIRKSGDLTLIVMGQIVCN